jgi:hypothetical protein
MTTKIRVEVEGVPARIDARGNPVVACKGWTAPEWPHDRTPTYAERIQLIDQILVKLPKVETKP